MLHKKLQKGRSMIEMIAVLAIIGIITVGAIAGINQGFVKYRTSKTFTEINAINQGIYGMYKYFRKYPLALNWDDARDSNVFPSGCEVDEDRAFNPFGGEYTVNFGRIQIDDSTGEPVFANVTDEADVEVMQICASGMPEAACEELQNMTWGGYSRTDGTCTANVHNNSLSDFCIIFQ